RLYLTDSLVAFYGEQIRHLTLKPSYFFHLCQSKCLQTFHLWETRVWCLSLYKSLELKRFGLALHLYWTLKQIRFPLWAKKLLYTCISSIKLDGQLTKFNLVLGKPLGDS